LSALLKVRLRQGFGVQSPHSLKLRWTIRGVAQLVSAWRLRRQGLKLESNRNTISYSTYILFRRSIGRYYIGHTEDLERRIDEHNRGFSKWTRLGIPWEIVYHIEFETKSESIKYENKIKKRGACRFLQDQFQKE
jgi:putative endonuclease